MKWIFLCSSEKCVNNPQTFAVINRHDKIKITLKKRNSKIKINSKQRKFNVKIKIIKKSLQHNKEFKKKNPQQLKKILKTLKLFHFNIIYITTKITIMTWQICN